MTANNEDGSQPPPAASESEPLSTTDTTLNSSSASASASASEHASSSSPPTSDRSELLDRARHFLNSPQVIDQDNESKRRFLAGKGLTDGGIQLLLRETVRPVHIYPPFDTQCLIVRKAFAVASRATTDVSRTCTVPSARPSRRYLQGAFMAGRRFHDPTIYLLRTYARTSHSDHGPTWPASDSCFPALRNRHSPVARSRHAKATFSPS
jgi:peroxisomal membrane anchor protein 14 (PEX14)